MSFACGDIYLVIFNPAVGREYKKIKPAIVLQQEKISKVSPYVTIMPISSKLDRMTKDDIFITSDRKNNLVQNSIIKVHQISSFDRVRCIKKIGEVGSPVLRQARGYLRRHFGL